MSLKIQNCTLSHKVEQVLAGPVRSKTSTDRLSDQHTRKDLPNQEYLRSGRHFCPPTSNNPIVSHHYIK